jgi:hypothetical protein
MFVIREQQFRLLGRMVREQLAEELARTLRARLPSSVAHLDDAEVDARIETALARAEHHGLSLRGSVMLFVLLAFGFGADFDQRPQVRPFLVGDDRDARFVRIVEEAPLACWRPATQAEIDASFHAWPRLVR